MPNNTPQVPQSQAPRMSPTTNGMPQLPQNQMSQLGQQGKQEINPEKMLIQMLKEMEQNIEDLTQRVDILEQKSPQNIAPR